MNTASPPLSIGDLVESTLRHLGQLSAADLNEDAWKLPRVRQMLGNQQAADIRHQWNHIQGKWFVVREQALKANAESGPMGILELIDQQRRGAFTAMCQRLEGELAKAKVSRASLLDLTETVGYPSLPSIAVVHIDCTWGVAEAREGGDAD